MCKKVHDLISKEPKCASNVNVIQFILFCQKVNPAITNLLCSCHASAIFTCASPAFFLTHFHCIAKLHVNSTDLLFYLDIRKIHNIRKTQVSTFKKILNPEHLWVGGCRACSLVSLLNGVRHTNRKVDNTVH